MERQREIQERTRRLMEEKAPSVAAHGSNRERVVKQRTIAPEFFVICVTLTRVGLDRHAPVSSGDEPLSDPPGGPHWPPNASFWGICPSQVFFQFNYCGVFNAYHTVKF